MICFPFFGIQNRTWTYPGHTQIATAAKGLASCSANIFLADPEEIAVYSIEIPSQLAKLGVFFSTQFDGSTIRTCSW